MPDNHTKNGQLSQGERQVIEILRKNNTVRGEKRKGNNKKTALVGVPLPKFAKDWN